MNQVRRFESSLGPISYRAEGEGHPILMIHSLGTSSRLYDGVTPLLGVAWVTPDSMGHGLSGPPKRDVTIPEHADALVELMDHLGAETFDVVGTSMGGLIGIDMAARYGDRVSALVLNGCPGWHLESQRTGRLVSSGLHGYIDENGLPSKDVTPGGTVRPKTPEHEAMRREDAQRVGRFFVSSAWASAAFDLTTRLGKIHCPTLVMYGDKDFHLGTGYNLVENIEGARLQLIANSGHLTPYDDPEAVAETVLRFFGRTSAV